MSRRRCASAVRESGIATLLVAACFSESEVGESTADGSTSGATTTIAGTSSTEPSADSTTGSACEDTDVPPFDLPWQGPVAIPMPGSDATACPDALTPGPRGYANAGEAACDCVCEADEPHELCAIRLDTSGECMLPDEPATSSCVTVPPGAVRYGIVGSMCMPSGVLHDDELTTVQACALEGSACVTVPQGWRGPCVWSDEPSCPPGYPNAFASDRIECGACDPCDTTEYCSSIAVVGWSAADCAGDSTPLTAECDPSRRAALQFTTDTTAACGATEATRTPLRFCCV